MSAPHSGFQQKASFLPPWPFGEVRGQAGWRSVKQTSSVSAVTRPNMMKQPPNLKEDTYQSTTALEIYFFATGRSKADFPTSICKFFPKVDLTVLLNKGHSYSGSATEE